MRSSQTALSVRPPQVIQSEHAAADCEYVSVNVSPVSLNVSTRASPVSANVSRKRPSIASTSADDCKHLHIGSRPPSSRSDAIK